MAEKKTLQQKLHERKIKQPPCVIYPLLGNIWKLIFYKKLGVNIDYKIDPKSLEGPFIVVSNHASRLDYLYTAIALLPHKMNVVAGYNEFFRSHLRLIFHLMQVIPKKNFTSDVYTIKEIVRRIKSGGKVLLFPEGMSSIGGGNQPCAIGSGKLLKHLGVPVYMTRISGGYLTSTKYCLDERPGRVDVVFDVLFTPEQMSAMSADEIQRSLDKAIHNDDYEWNKKERVSFDAHGETAKNIHTLLYRCPRCGAEFTMHGEGDTIKCTSCGNGAHINGYYDLIPFDGDCVIPSTPRVWLDMEREQIKRELESDDFIMSEHVKLGTLPKYETLKNQATSVITGEGTLTLTHGGFSFAGVNNSEPFSFTVAPQILPTFGMCTDVSRFYTFVDGEFYEFYPERESTEKWLLAVEENHRRSNGAWKDFPKD